MKACAHKVLASALPFRVATFPNISPIWIYKVFISKSCLLKHDIIDSEDEVKRHLRKTLVIYALIIVMMVLTSRRAWQQAP